MVGVEQGTGTRRPPRDSRPAKGSKLDPLKDEIRRSLEPLGCTPPGWCGHAGRKMVLYELTDAGRELARPVLGEAAAR